jgi:hypothetical protein
VDGVRRTAGATRTPLVQERRQGGQRRDEQAAAFRRAMEQHSAEAATDAPVPPALQPRPRDSRRDPGEAHHIDVVA